jgi:putative membrane-bound dehydrogenase-like protein
MMTRVPRIIGARCIMLRMTRAALAVAAILVAASDGLAQDVRPGTYDVGVAKMDITPAYAVRLSGFGFRRTESEGITQRIWAKALALRDEAGEPAVLVTVDNLGIPYTMTRAVAERLKAKLPADCLAITATHTHTAPMLTGVAPTLFGLPIADDHQQRINRYTAELTDHLEKVALAALADLKPAKLNWGVGKVGFAINRRTKGGPVDHDLPLLVVRDLQGKVRAIYVSYACHCVTLSNNKISGDWAGYSQELIEDDHRGAIALVSIGCGGDQNPSSGVTGDKVELARIQGAEIAKEVRRLVRGYLAPVTGKLIARTRTLELPLADLPTREQWEAKAKTKGAAGYHAQVNLDRLVRKEPLKTKIDYPVRTWSFGDSLALAFLPGEVVVDYSLRLKKELDRGRLWINAYANDAPCYIPSERVLKEGGYEGGAAMIYYDLPAPLRPGLEDKIVSAVKELLGPTFKPAVDEKKTGGTHALSPQQSLATIQTKAGLKVQLVAAEPLVASPVAIDFGPDGKLWVAEMADYPTGPGGKYEPGGRIKVLEDTDGDGVYDKATVFLDGLPFPTGVTVWRKGVLICAAPDILYAEDTDGDGKADVVRKLFSGFGTHNYQARVNSLAWALDGWVYGSCGLFGGKIECFGPGGKSLVVNLGDRDFRIDPDHGLLEPATGRTQQGRVRNDWDDWFGCDNSNLCRHYPLADHYLKRNPHVAVEKTAYSVPDYPDSHRLYPLSKELQLFKLSGPPGHTTAACGLGIYRDNLLGADYQGNAFVCEPVNLLVHRLVLTPKSSTFSGRRAKGKEKSEFLASTDTWFRPVQVRTGPDGSLWVVDMYRYVIEHPRWIPPEDLAKADLRAGSSMGRIYRVFAADQGPRPIRRLDTLKTPELVALLDSANGWQRDLASQMLLWNPDPAAVAPLEKMAAEATRPEARVHALAVLAGMGRLRPALVATALADGHAGVRRHAVRLAEPLIAGEPGLGPLLLKRALDADAQVRLQLAYTLGAWRDPRAGTALADVLANHAGDPFLAAAVFSSLNAENLPVVITRLFERHADALPPPQQLQRLFGTAAALKQPQLLTDALRRVTAASPQGYARWQLAALAGILSARPFEALTDNELRPVVQGMLAHARKVAASPATPEDERILALGLLGQEKAQRDAETTLLRDLLAPQNPTAVQAAAMTAAGKFPGDVGAGLLIERWKQLTPPLQTQALDVLLSREPWQALLLDRVAKGEIPAGNIDAARRQRLLASKSEAIRTRAAQLFAQAGADRQKVLAAYQDVTTSAGDAKRGKAVFVKSCAACHRLGDVGNAVGPDLASLSTKTPAYLLIEILDPNRNVDSRYVGYLAVTRAGRSFTGVLTAETATSITLRGQDGKEQAILRADLDELISTGRSLMPEGLERDLSRQDLADVIAFIRHGS